MMEHSVNSTTNMDNISIANGNDGEDKYDDSSAGGDLAGTMESHNHRHRQNIDSQQQQPGDAEEHMQSEVDSTIEEEISMNSSRSVATSHATAAGHMRHLDAEQHRLGRRETKRVTCARFIVFGILMTSAITVSTLVYYFVRNDEEKDFCNHFDAHASRILELFHKSVENKLKALDSFSSSVTSYAIDSGSTFPNVTIPNMEVRGNAARVNAEALLIYYLPLVHDEDRAGWEAYAKAHANHLPAALAADDVLRRQQDVEFGYDPTRRMLLNSLNGNEQAQQAKQGHASQTKRSLEESPPPGYREHIFDITTLGADSYGPEPIGSGPFLPIWQMTPVIDLVPALNLNMLSYNFLKGVLTAAYTSGEAVVGRVINLQDPVLSDKIREDNVDTFQIFLDRGQFRHDSQGYFGDPVSPVNYPVFDSFGKDRKVVGIMYTSIYWRLYFESLLSEDVKGIVCVLENTLNQTFSFRLDGSRVTYIGKSDRHDPKYDSMGHEANIAEYVASIASPETRSYTSVKLNRDHSNYRIRVYPTSNLEDEFVSTRPIWYALVVGLVFVFTSAVFIFYDYLVEHRQRLVMDQAIKSGAVVSSLFPENVRDRLYSHHGNDGGNKGNNGNGIGGMAIAGRGGALNITKGRQQASLHPQPNQPLNAFLDKEEVKTDATVVSNTTSRPIADKFEHTTILFADIAGFTKWSSTRTPEQVFDLLETLFGTFDRLARRHNVFKVETIGDCYMAATGLPSPRVRHELRRDVCTLRMADHAVAMVQFAHDCLRKMHSLRHSLSKTLGLDTLELEMRVGLHSGPVTAGVLRGEKSRFQLFGDTVNTASRMESSGERSRVHCSQATADELIAQGYTEWLQRRHSTVEVKGKGEMQTYFVSIKAERSQRSSGNGDMLSLPGHNALLNANNDEEQ